MFRTLDLFIFLRILFLSADISIGCKSSSTPYYALIGGGRVDTIGEVLSDQVELYSPSKLCSEGGYPEALPYGLEGATAQFLPDWNSGTVAVCGGISEFQKFPLNKCFAWSYNKLGWTPLQDMRVPRSYAGSVVFNGELLIMGGFDNQRNSPMSLHTTEKLTGVDYLWTRGPDLPQPLAGFCSLTLDEDRILIIGGFSGFDISSSAWVYSKNKSNWTEVGSLQESRMGLSCAVIPGSTDKVIIAGGKPQFFGDTPSLNSVELMDITKGTTILLNDLPFDNSKSLLWSSILNLNGVLYHFSPGSPLLQYDTQSDRWFESMTNNKSDGRSYDRHIAVGLPSYMIPGYC